MVHEKNVSAVSDVARNPHSTENFELKLCSMTYSGPSSNAQAETETASGYTSDATVIGIARMEAMNLDATKISSAD